METKRLRLFCIRCDEQTYETIQTSLAVLSARTGLPRGRTLARLLEGIVKPKGPGRGAAGLAAARAAKRAAKAEPTTPDAT